MNDYKIIEINDETRIRVMQDESPGNPRTDWDSHLTGALTIYDRRNTIDVAPVHSWPELESAIGRFDISDRDNVRWYNEQQITKLIRWAAIFHDKVVDFDDGTLWWVDEDALVENFWSMADMAYSYGNEPIDKATLETNIIIQERRTYNDWAEGNVYGVVVEKLEAWTKNSTDEERTEWEEVEAVWGFYLDHERDEDEQFTEFAKDMVGDSWSVVSEDGTVTPLNDPPVIGGEPAEDPHPGQDHDWQLTEDGYSRTWSTTIHEDGSIDAVYNGTDDWGDEGDGNEYLSCRICQARMEIENLSMINYL